MLKQYLPRAASGATAAFWEENWHSQPAASLEALRSWDPLVPHFLENSAAGARVLEGGCGLGHYVQVLREGGRRAVGLDFALETLARIRRGDREVPLVGGDVAALPFRDTCCDVYVSQGVVEHFEGGPDAALAEAYRTLAPGGLLLISVPDFNLLRRILLFGRTRRRGGDPSGGHWVRVRRHDVTLEPPGMVFFQYLYRSGEFRALLAVHGFRVEWDRGYSVLWGLQDLGPFRVVFSRLAKRSRRSPAATNPNPAAAPRAVSRMSLKDRARRVLAREEGTGAVSAAVLGVLRATCANMRLYAARKPVGE